MEKDRIREIIQSEIQNAAVDVARNKIPKPKPQKEETKEEKIIRQAEAHNALFYAFEDEDTINNSKQRYLKEEEDATTKSNKSIPSSMVSQAESEFKQNVNPKTTFDNQKNGRSIYAINDNDGLEVIMSGSIKLSSNDTIRWTFSIKNGPSIVSQSELNDDFVTTITKMNSYYVSWKKKWQDYLSIDQAV
jgi:hypothetical protein